MKKFNWPHLRPGQDRGTLFLKVKGSPATLVEQPRESVVYINMDMNCSFMQTSISADSVSSIQQAKLNSILMKLQTIVRSNRTYGKAAIQNAISAGNLVYAAEKYALVHLELFKKIDDGNYAYSQWSDQTVIDALEALKAACEAYHTTLPVNPAFKKVVDAMGVYYFDRLHVYAGITPRYLETVVLTEGQSEFTFTGVRLPNVVHDSKFAADINTVTTQIFAKVTSLLAVQGTPKAAGDICAYAPECKLSAPNAYVKDLTTTRAMLKNTMWVNPVEGKEGTIIVSANGSWNVKDVGGAWAALVYSGVDDTKKGNTAYVNLVQKVEDEFAWEEISCMPIQLTNERNSNLTVACQVYATAVVSAVVSESITESDQSTGALVIETATATGTNREDQSQLNALINGMGFLPGITVVGDHTDADADTTVCITDFDDRFYHTAVNAEQLEQTFGRVISDEILDTLFYALKPLKTGKQDKPKADAR